MSSDQPPIQPDYDDEITVETISRLNKIVSDDEFVDYKDVFGPAWNELVQAEGAARAKAT